MKKMLVIILAILLLFGGFVTWSAQRAPESPAVQPDAEEAAPTPDSAPAAEPDAVVEEPAAAGEEAAAPAEIRRVDLEALRTLHPADETVMSLGEERVSWGEFSDLLGATCLDIENYFEQMAAYYGVAADWDGSVGDGSGQSFAQYAVNETRDYLASSLAVRALAAEKGVSLDAAELAALEPEALAKELFGEEGTVEQLYDSLENEGHMSYETYRMMRETSLLYTKTVELLYGLEGEKISEDEAVAWLEDQGFLSAGHILLMTMDPNTGEPVDEAAAQAKRERAGEIAAELQGIKDREKLLKRFAELKEAECEDSGKAAYPDGYTFEPGTMVTEFENAVRGLEDYAVSDPVQTAYGYHVIMRLPLKADAGLITLTGDAASAQQSLAQQKINDDLAAFEAAHPAEIAESVESFELAPYLK